MGLLNLFTFFKNYLKMHEHVNLIQYRYGYQKVEFSAKHFPIAFHHLSDQIFNNEYTDI